MLAFLERRGGGGGPRRGLGGGGLPKGGKAPLAPTAWLSLRLRLVWELFSRPIVPPPIRRGGGRETLTQRQQMKLGTLPCIPSPPVPQHHLPVNGAKCGPFRSDRQRATGRPSYAEHQDKV